MAACRCAILNVLSGALAQELVDEHLREIRSDGMGRSVYLCATSEVEWVEEHRRGGYEKDVTVLRRVQR